MLELPVRSHFGACPVCHRTTGRLNVGRDHWFYCRHHRVKWYGGRDIFPDWRSEAPDQWKKNESLLDFLLEIEPVLPWDLPDTEDILALQRERAGRRDLTVVAAD